MAHHLTVERTLQPVVKHVVEGLAVPHAHAAARARQQVGCPFVIDSMPPASTTFALPAAMRSWPNMTVFRPDPQTLLTVVHGVPRSTPGAQRGLTCRCLAQARGQHAADQHLVDGVGVDSRLRVSDAAATGGGRQVGRADAARAP